MKKNILIVIYLLIVWIETSCIPPSAKKTMSLPPMTIEDFCQWQLDTCGLKGSRALLVDVIDTKKDFLIGKDRTYIEYYFGPPDRVTSWEEYSLIYYEYICDALEIKSNGECGMPNGKSLSIMIDGKRSKVKEIVLKIH